MIHVACSPRDDAGYRDAAIAVCTCARPLERTVSRVPEEEVRAAPALSSVFALLLLAGLPASAALFAFGVFVLRNALFATHQFSESGLSEAIVMMSTGGGGVVMSILAMRRDPTRASHVESRSRRREPLP